MPVGLIALIFLIWFMPLLAPEHRGRFDLPGILTLTLWVVPLVLALSWAGSTYPWGSWQVAGLLAFAVAALVFFVLVELRSEEPLIELSLFRDTTFR